MRNFCVLIDEPTAVSALLYACMHVYKHAYGAQLFSTITISHDSSASPETSMGSEAPDPAVAASVPLVRLNHVSFQCTSVEKSVDFYRRVLGFELIKRPESLSLVSN
jgi:hypothetical protein